MSTTPGAGARNYTAERTVRALELLAFGPHSAPELAAALSIHPRTARRLLAALATAGYVQRPAGTGAARRYHATLRPVSLAVQLARHSPTVARARELVRDVHAATGLGAYAVMPTHADVVVLASAGQEAPTPWAVMPARTCAGGRVLLAQRPGWRGLLGATAQEDTEAAVIRERGYALAPEGPKHLAVAVAVGVSPTDGAEFEFALVVIGPAESVDVEPAELAQALVAQVSR